jgi:hypothetical protein
MLCAVLPQLLESGLLPDGQHPAAWHEVAAVFGQGGHRGALIAGLRLACMALAIAGCRRLWLDGSFVSSKPQPADYDACWDPDGVDPLLLDPLLLDWSPAGRLRMRAKYLGDVFIAGTEQASGLPFVSFFQTDRDGTAKGIVVIRPEEVS